jgi:hypothetical protein
MLSFVGGARPRQATLLSTCAGVLALLVSSNAQAATISNAVFNVQIGSNGEISSLQLTNDAFPTNYVMNATNAPGQNTADHEWVGELMFKYRLGTGAWQTALTNQSSDVRAVTTSGNTVTVTYQNSGNASGVKNFKVVESYSLVNSALVWSITVTNTSTQSIEFGDFGLPLPFNEYWFGNDVIYETRTVYHSFTGQNSSYITVGRPSGVGDFLLMVPDPTTGAGFEYMDNWIDQEHTGSAWAANGGTPSWSNGLDVFYLHSNVIKSTNRGYLPNTSLTLAAGQSQTYTFNFLRVKSHDDAKTQIYNAGLIDVTALPGMMFSTDMTAKFDLHTTATIASVTPQYPSETTLTPVSSSNGHTIYSLKLSHLGPNNLVVSYGNNLTTTLQFYALEPLATAIQRHATFMVNNMQWTDKTLDYYGVIDDWMMEAKAKRGDFSGGWGWGDDWGWTHGEFLAEKESQTPVAAEVTALDIYLTAVWNRAIDHTQYIVQDWWCPAGTSATNINNCYYDRAFAYPHAFNTFFGMYKTAKRYPSLVTYQNTADTYLMRAYNILHALYNGHGDPGTGYMGEQTLPEIMAALTTEGHTTEAADVKSMITAVYNAFSGATYPYGSEYSYDNTGEEAVYMSAIVAGDSNVLSKVNTKTRACRGQEPVWYYYADPVSVNGENWWQFQYSTALIGWAMSDWVQNHSTTPELDERLTYAAKIGNISAINSGQIDTAAANLGATGWTYQGAKGNTDECSADCNDTLHNDWRGMSGEADLGLFGAIRILSADVSNDPLFGLFGYGCDVTVSGGCYAVTPRDGVQKKINLVTEKLHIELDRDRYTVATLSTGKTSVGLTLQNDTPSAAHTTNLTLAGFSPGTYDVDINGAKVSSVTVPASGQAVVALAIGTSATYAIQIGAACAVTATDAGTLDAATDSDAVAATDSASADSASTDSTVADTANAATDSASASDSATHADASDSSTSGRNDVGGDAGNTTESKTGCQCNSAPGGLPGSLETLVGLASLLLLTRRTRRRALARVNPTTTRF